MGELSGLIEQDEGLYGRIRGSSLEVAPWQITYPDLVACRPEPWRFFRLNRIIGAAKAMAATELGDEGAAAMMSAVVEVLDAKGDFAVIWKRSGHEPRFERFFDRALEIEREPELVHQFDDEMDGALWREA